MNYIDFYKILNNTSLNSYINEFEKKIEQNLCSKRHPQIIEWNNLLDKVPTPSPEQINLKSGVIAEGDFIINLEEDLKKFSPWRKGPFVLYGTKINSEWRSDWKWERLINLISPLKDKNILDIGCGNGYHLWRMIGEGARLVIGIDPQPLFIYQFFVIKKLLGRINNCWALPLTFEEFPNKESYFDTCFSMGVIYHRKNPLKHLNNINKILKKNGEIILETLIVDSKEEDLIIPKGRYAKMNNVWFIPSIETTVSWLKKSNFKNIRVLNVAPTTTKEQRSTEWMRFESLNNFLDKKNPEKTVEGYPAPIRAIFSAKKK